MVCPHCGKENVDDARFCVECGKELPASDVQIDCPHCGEENVATAKFCHACGKDLLPSLGKMPVLLLIFLLVITFGIYAPIWFLTKRRALNELRSSKKIGIEAPIFLIVIYTISFLLDLTHGFERGPWRVLDFIGLIIVTVQCFDVRRILIDHFNVYMGRDINFSGIATLFFGIPYLQYKINRL
jgi:predicted RNA-binding Zn-ribbon protein involved in translation (DUF1610 family)